VNLKHVTSWLKEPRAIAFGAVCSIAGFLVALLIFRWPGNLAPNWGDIPTWLAVIIASIGGWIALSQLRGQSAVIKRDAEDRRREQAMSVYIRPIGSGGRAEQPFAANASQYPVFDAQLWFTPDGPPDSLGGPDDLGAVLPKESQGTQRQIGKDVIYDTVILTFRDANGVSWIRMPGGALLEQTKPTARDSVIAALTATRRAS
jgi:hypothetical protein